MSGVDCNTEEKQQTKKNILDLSNAEARGFLLKPESYCTIDLPSYISFAKILDEVDSILSEKELSDFSKKPENHENVNYTILNNKDGKYAWRPLQIIHPALYVSLVHKITEEGYWKHICNKFNEFSKNKNIQCFSLPVVSTSEKKDKEEQILHWWNSIEQKSIELSLDYEYLIETDITDCYGSIYTHSIAWALHTKSIAKRQRNDNSLIGNIIDKHIQAMQNGQTNGIPQGSVLMDFIAEIVLGYADTILSERLQKEKVTDDYFILRYRDDYRIFVNNPQIGNLIIKLLTSITSELGMKINPQKTKSCSTVIKSSIKADKLTWNTKIKSDKNLQKHLLIIHNHAMEHPNSGSISRALSEYHRRIAKLEKYNQPLPLIAIIVDIAYSNPRTYAACASIISKLLSFLQADERIKIIEKIKTKFYKIPNTGYMQIWLQRITFPFSPETDYDEPICKLITGKITDIWNNNWISSEKLNKKINAANIVDKENLKDIDYIIPLEEVELFTSNNWEGY